MAKMRLVLRYTVNLQHVMPRRPALMTHETILIQPGGRVGLITLNRPKALNVLNQQLAGELLQAVETLDRDPGVGCIVITGTDKAFSAGGDIKAMQDHSYMDMYFSDHYADWDRLVAVRTPVIAAVAGFALGGG